MTDPPDSLVPVHLRRPVSVRAIVLGAVLSGAFVWFVWWYLAEVWGTYWYAVRVPTLVWVVVATSGGLLVGVACSHGGRTTHIGPRILAFATTLVATDLALRHVVWATHARGTRVVAWSLTVGPLVAYATVALGHRIRGVRSSPELGSRVVDHPRRAPLLAGLAVGAMLLACMVLTPGVHLD